MIRFARDKPRKPMRPANKLAPRIFYSNPIKQPDAASSDSSPLFNNRFSRLQVTICSSWR